MNFVKKNIGLLIFTLLFLGGLTYLLLQISGQAKTRDEEVAKEKQHVEFFERLAKENLMLNEGNRQKAQQKLEKATDKYAKMRNQLAKKRLVRETDREYKDFMALDPTLAQNWMKNYLEKIMADNFDPFFMHDKGSSSRDGGMDEGDMTAENEGMDISRSSIDSMSLLAFRKRKEELEKRLEAMDTETHLMLQGAKLPKTLFFGPYVELENGLNPDEMARIYKAVKVSQLVLGLARECNIVEVSEFDLPKGIEKADESTYEWTPITMKVVAEQPQIQKFLNKLTTHEDYFFVIRCMDIKAMDYLAREAYPIKRYLDKDMEQLFNTLKASGDDSMDYDREDDETVSMQGKGSISRRARTQRRQRKEGLKKAVGMASSMTGEMEIIGVETDDREDAPYRYRRPMSRKDMMVFEMDKDVILDIRFDLFEFKPVENN